MAPESFHRARRPLTMITMAVSVLSLAVIVVGLNYLAAQHPWRTRWFQNDRFELSPLTQGILKGLDQEILVILYQNRDDSSALHTSIEGLLKEYAYLSPSIRIRRVDYVQDREAAQQVEQDYELIGRAPSDLVVFATEERHRIVTLQELRDYQSAARAKAILEGQQETKRVGFRGELLFTSAILNLTSGTAPKVAYLVGHGEHDLDDESQNGYQRFRQALEEKNFEVTAHHLLQDGPIPEATQLVVIAGARMAFAPSELAELNRFLRQGGRLFVLFNYNGILQATGLEELLKQWGVDVGMNVVDDVHKLGSELYVAEYQDHPITTPLVDAKSGLLMFLPRSITPLPRPADTLAGDYASFGLGFTTTNGFTKSDLQGNRLVYSHYRDQKGSIPLMAAVEIAADPSPINQAPRQARLLVTGDSFFLSNARIHQSGNRDFATLGPGWLLDQYELLQGIGPQPVYEFKLSIPNPDLKRLQWWMLLILPGIVFAFGMIVWWRRRA